MKKRLIALLLVLALLIPAAVASAATWYRVNTTSLRVRFLPDTSAKEIGSYRKDYACTVGKTLKDGWSYVTFSNGTEGYVQSKYITKASSYKAWIYKDDTSLRKGPDGSFQAIASLAQGTKVTVLSHGSKYDYVSAGDLGQGYVVNSLLSKKKVKASGNKSESTQASGGNYTAWIMSTGKVRLRKSPNSNAPIIASYNPGKKVTVIKHGNTWDKVKVGSKTGYINNKYLTTSKPAETEEPAEKPKSGSYTAYVVSGNKKPVNVRKGNSTNYSVVFKVKYGQAVKVLKHNAKWDYIQHGSKKGYIENKYLQLSKPSGTNSTLAPKTTPKPFSKYTAEIYASNGKSVNVHKGMGDSYSNICRLKVGTEEKELTRMKNRNSLAVLMFIGLLLIVVFAVGLAVDSNPSALKRPYRYDYAMEQFGTFCSGVWLPAGIVGIPLFLVSLIVSLVREKREKE